MTRQRGRFVWLDAGGDELHRTGNWFWTGDEPPGPEDIQTPSQKVEPCFWSMLQRIADGCDRKLTDAKFPRVGVEIRYSEDGFWCLAEGVPGRAPANVRIHFANNGAVYAREFAKPFSDPWYAGDLASKCRRVLSTKDRLTEEALTEIMEIGIALRDWEWRRGFKPFILTGRSVRAGGKRGGQMRAGNFAPDTEARLAEMDRLISGGRKVKDAAEALARRGIGKSASANKRLWERHRDKRK